jgi:hypothetical protein
VTNFLVSDKLHSHPVVRSIPRRWRLRCIGAWAMAGSWCAAHDLSGYIPKSAVTELGITRGAVRYLLQAELWDAAEDGGGYWLAHGTDPIWPLWEMQRTDYRRKIPADVRALVFARDGFACVECGATDRLSLDHVHPWSLGGSDHESNLRTLCRPCNSRKGNRVEAMP